MAARPHHPLVFHPLTVADVRLDTDDAVVVTFTVPPELTEEYRFAHGHHVTLRRSFDGTEVRRSYSICSPAGGPLRVGVRLVEGGVFSSWLHGTLRPGDTVDVMTPTGGFTCDLDPGVARRYVAVAAGSGITPVRSIVETVLATEHDSTATLVYVNRTTASTMFLEELQALKDRYLGRFALWLVSTREEGDIELLSGRPDRDRLARFVAATVLPVDGDAYFLCGPLPLVEATREVLAEAGVPVARVHTELFGTGPFGTTPPTGTASGTAGAPRLADRPPSSSAAERPVAMVTATLNGRTTEFGVAEGESILEAALRVRPDVPYSCTAGVCATCRASVEEGKVDMDVAYGLEPDEVAAGYVLTCQARPLTARVRIDYDR